MELVEASGTVVRETGRKAMEPLIMGYNLSGTSRWCWIAAELYPESGKDIDIVASSSSVLSWSNPVGGTAISLTQVVSSGLAPSSFDNRLESAPKTDVKLEWQPVAA